MGNPPILVKGEADAAGDLRMAEVAASVVTKRYFIVRAMQQQPLLKVFVRALASVSPDRLQQLLAELKKEAA